MSTKAAISVAVVVVAVVAALGIYFLPNLGGGTSVSTGVCSSAGHSGPTGEWTTYHRDNSRAGYASVEEITCASRGWTSSILDGLIYAEPLVFGGGVYVATENNSIYALNAETGEVVWRAHLGDPVPRSSLPCGNIDPTGITGTPVIDQASSTIYAVPFVNPGNHLLVALSTVDGSLRFSRSADPAGANPKVEQQRGALSLANGTVYIPYGGLFGDCGDYHGWMVGVGADGTGQLLSYQVPTERAGGIWAPSGGAIDSSGNIFVATGNGASATSFDHGNSVVELSPGLQEVGYFAPSNWLQLNQADTDLGSVGPAVLGNGVLFQIGKQGVGYLLRTADLGGIGGQAYSAKVCSSAFGGTAHAGDLLFVPCTDGLVALRVAGASFAVAWTIPQFQAGPPIVTSDVVWAVGVSTGTLRGFDSSSGHQLYSFNLGPVNRFTTPSFGYGRLFVATGHQVASFVVG